MNTLEILWFVLIGVLWAGFFFLEGFDFGIGMQFIFNARDENDRDALYEAIGPNWDANEVWLITAGGAMFAAFPNWYASLFSG
ncbi:MAG: cytochrome d ubiquinol oxidase subunit II, partial [Leuconostoc lactis]